MQQMHSSIASVKPASNTNSASSEHSSASAAHSPYASPQPSTISHTLPSVLHLTPCPWEDFVNIEFSPHQNIDLVSGYIISRPEKLEAEHQDIISYLCTLINMSDLPCDAVFKPPSKVVDKAESSSDSSRNSNSPPRRIPGTRQPDIALCRRDESSSSSSASPPHKKGRFKFFDHKQPLANIEVTSPITRTEDLYDKWAVYARTAVPLYIVLDRPHAREDNGADPTPTVIVGSLQPRPGWLRCSNGDPGYSPRKARATTDSSDTPRYYRTAFSGDQVVNCPYLAILQLTAKQILDPKYLRHAVQELRKHQKKAAHERDT